jgi:hypothetical protein
MGLALAKQDDPNIAFADKPAEERHRILKAALAAGILFLWDRKRGKFISTKTGRVIRADTLRKWVIEASQKSEGRLAKFAEMLAAGVPAGPTALPPALPAALPAAPASAISHREFQMAVQKEIAKAESSMVASAVGGLKQMKVPEWQRVAIQIRKQQAALVGFSTDIVQNRLSSDQIISRAQLYARAIYATHMNQMTDLKEGMGSKFARRILHQGAIHCEDCPPLAKLGWVPIENLVPIGDTACIVNCRCAIEYSGEGQPSAATMIGMPD